MTGERTILSRIQNQSIVCGYLSLGPDAPARACPGPGRREMMGHPPTLRPTDLPAGTRHRDPVAPAAGRE
ncbi:hypothetical protein GCM10023088_76400 [Actinomadura verrucosospora]